MFQQLRSSHDRFERRLGLMSWAVWQLLLWCPLPGHGEQYNFTLAFLTSVGNHGTGKHSGGAFFVALEKLNNASFVDEVLGSSNDDGVFFHWYFEDTRNDEMTAIRAMADINCKRTNVTVFIGPDVFCSNAAILATAFNLPYISYDCNDINKLEKMAEYNIVNLEPSLAYVSKWIVTLMKYYGWESFWLLTGTDQSTNPWADTGEYLMELAKNNSIHINGETRNARNEKYNTMSNFTYTTTIRDSEEKTRIYVFLGTYGSLVDFLRELSILEVTSRGEHVVIAVDDEASTSTSKSFLRIDERSKVNVTDAHVQSFRNLLLIRRQSPAVTSSDFHERVYAKNYLPPINLKKPPSTITSKVQLTKEAYYLHDAVMYYGTVVLDLIRQGEDPRNASLVIKSIRNKTFESSQGFKVHINEQGASEGSYVVFAVASNASGLVWNLWQVGSFTINNEKLEYVPTNNSMFWVKDKPISEPECGFENSKCKHLIPSENWKLVAIGVGLALLLLLAMGSLFVGLRHFMYEKRLDRLAWKIEYSAIQLLDAGQVHQMISPGRPRKKVQNRWKIFLPGLMENMENESGQRSKTTFRHGPGIRVGLYKGSHVAVRPVTRRNLELNRALKKALLARKEMNHENINRFIGACIDPPRVYIVTQFCSRRSLQDILKNEDSPLDDMFITSLVQDLYKGMTFIHDSDFGYHGNLKSSKCLVDSRWVLKIADFGLGALKGFHSLHSGLWEENCAKLLWRAPELLKVGSVRRGGSQKGDVYSFAIILYELYGRRGPWGDTHLTSNEIIQRLRSEDYKSLGIVRPFRPDTSVLQVKDGVVPLMHACWHPDPDQRPDFKNGIRVKLKPIQQGLLKSNIFDNMLAMMEKYAHNLEAVVAERTEQLSMEKRMTENLLLRMLPRSVAEHLKHGKPVAPEQYDQVSIYFSDIVGFTELSAQSTPMQVVDMLNDLYTCFDSILENYDVYKVETIGDAYMVVSGLPIRNGLSHAGEVASMSLHLLSAIKHFQIRHRPEATLKIRIGIHSGPCCAGVVGLKMPRYCLFGDTVNTASRLESTGEALKIHCSQECKAILDSLGGYHLEERGFIDMKGKGKRLTYFLIGEDHNQRMRRLSSKKSNGDGDRQLRCVSTGNMDYAGKLYSMQNGLVSELWRVYTPQDAAEVKSSQTDHSRHTPYHERPSLSSIASSGCSDTLSSNGVKQNGFYANSPMPNSPTSECEEPREYMCLLDTSRKKLVSDFGLIPETVL